MRLLGQLSVERTKIELSLWVCYYNLKRSSTIAVLTCVTVGALGDHGIESGRNAGERLI